MKQSPAELTSMTRLSVAVADNDDGRRATSLHETSDDQSTNALLKTMCDQLREIRDVLEARGRSEQQRGDDDKENEMTNDWMLAAAVLNRICAIVFTIILVGGTAIFFVVFAVLT